MEGVISSIDDVGKPFVSSTPSVAGGEGWNDDGLQKKKARWIGGKVNARSLEEGKPLDLMVIAIGGETRVEL